MKNRNYLIVQLVLVSIFLVLLVLSDFGLIFVTENMTARILLHIALLFNLISTVNLWRKYRGK